jgi:hypothetical protein
MPELKSSTENDYGIEYVCEGCGKKERDWNTPDGWFFFRVIARGHNPPDQWHMPKTDFDFCSLDCANGWIARATEWPGENVRLPEESND